MPRVSSRDRGRPASAAVRAGTACGLLCAWLLVTAAPAAGEDAPPAPAPTPSPSPTPSPLRATRFSLAPTIDSDLLRDLPFGHGLWSAFETFEPTAIVDRIENGGLYVGEPGLLGVRGSSWTQTSWRLDGLDITDPDRTGTPLLLADNEALEAIDVAAGLASAAEPGAGPSITLRLRRPAAAWHKALEADLVPSGTQQGTSRGGAPAIAHYDGFASSHLRVDGPLVKDRLGLLVAASRVRSRRLERADPRPLEGRETGVLAHLVYTPASGDELRVIGAVQATLHPYAGRARFGGGDVREAGSYRQLQSTWEHRGQRPWSLSAGYARGAFDPELGDAGGVVDRLRDGPLQQQFGGTSRRSRLGISGWVDPLTNGRQALRLGGSLAWDGSNTRPAGPRGLTPETVNGLPARLWDYGWAGPESRWRGLDAALYLDNRLRFGPLALQSGVRFESTRARAQGTPRGIDWQALSPRLSARLRVTGGLTLLGGYARYRHRLPLNLLGFGDPTAAQGVVYRWLDANGDGVFQPGERGPLLARVGPGGPFSSIDPGLRPPRSKEVFVGFDARAGSWGVRFLAYHRREKDFVTSVNVGAPASVYDVSYVPDPGDDIVGSTDDYLLPIYNRRPESFGQDRYLLTNDREKGQDKGLEVTIAGTIGKRLRLHVGATASKSFVPAGYTGFLATENDPGVVGERLEDPNATTLSKGRPFFERGYTLHAAATFRAPCDIRLGAVARYQDGQHFARLVIPTDLNQGPVAIKAIYNGDSRFTYVLTLDLRLEKGFSAGRTRLAAILEAFNLRGSAIEVEEDVAWGPSYRVTSAVQPPRAIRLGLRWEF